LLRFISPFYRAGDVRDDIVHNIPFLSCESVDSFIPNRYFLPPETITCNIEELQNVIDSLPKYLNCNVIINCLPGTITTGLKIAGFCGPGMLTINGQANILGTTHNIQNIIITGCKNLVVTINGFNITGTTTRIVSVTASNHVNIEWMKIISSASTVHGVLFDGVARAELVNCEISNRNRSIETSNTKLVCNNISGSGNSIGYMSYSGGVLSIISFGAYTATTLFSIVQGGIIIGPDGTLLPRPKINNLVLSNNWSAVSTFPYSYYKDYSGNVIVNLHLQKTTAITVNGEPIAVLPVGYRPSQKLTASATLEPGSSFPRHAVTLLIEANGNIILYAGTQPAPPGSPCVVASSFVFQAAA